MALKKAIPTDYGVNAEYWNIGAAQEDFKGAGLHLTLYGYLDAAARQAGKQPLAAYTVQLTGDDYSPDAQRADWYGKLKGKPEWADAEDA